MTALIHELPSGYRQRGPDEIVCKGDLASIGESYERVTCDASCYCGVVGRPVGPLGAWNRYWTTESTKETANR